MKPGRSANEVHLARGIEHLRRAIQYGERGPGVFFDDDVPDTYLLVEAELRKAFESLNRLGANFFSANPRVDRERIGEIRQLLTHDYVDVERDVVWTFVQSDGPKILQRLLRAKQPTGGP